MTEESGEKNLLREGKPAGSVPVGGNVMIDHLFHQIEKLKSEEGFRFATQPLKDQCLP